MSDGLPLPVSSGKAATDEATYSGELMHVALLRLVGVTGAEGSKVVTDPLIPISAAVLPLPAGASSAAKQSDGSAKTQIVDGAGVVAGFSGDAVKVHIASGGAAGGTSLADEGTFTPGTTPVTPMAGEYTAAPESVPAGKAAAVAITPFRGMHAHPVDAAGVTLAVATAALQTAEGVLVGAVNEAAAGGDTASSGLNGLFKRALQGITTILARLPALVGGRIDVNIGAVAGVATTADIAWRYAAPALGLVNITPVTAKAAAGAGIRNYITRASIANSHQSIGTEVVIRDGAGGTVLYRTWANQGGGGESGAVFDPPLPGSANTLIEIQEISTTAGAGVLVNLNGYQAI